MERESRGGVYMFMVVWILIFLFCLFCIGFVFDSEYLRFVALVGVAFFAVLSLIDMFSDFAVSQIAAGYGNDKKAYCMIIEDTSNGSFSKSAVTDGSNNLVSSSVTWNGNDGSQHKFLLKNVEIENIPYLPYLYQSYRPYSYQMFIPNPFPSKDAESAINEFLAPFNLKESDCKVMQ